MPRVLLVEDDPQLRQILAGELRTQGFRCEEAENGRVGLEKMCEATFRHDPFDCILLDIMMPEVDGWQVLEALKANPLWSRAKVIVLSGRTLSQREIAKATAMDCVHVQKRGSFLENVCQMLTRMLAPAQ
jgi:CheY-like chemotaxis protein